MYIYDCVFNCVCLSVCVFMYAYSLATVNDMVSMFGCVGLFVCTYVCVVVTDHVVLNKLM